MTSVFLFLLFVLPSAVYSSSCPPTTSQVSYRTSLSSERYLVASGVFQSLDQSSTQAVWIGGHSISGGGSLPTRLDVIQGQSGQWWTNMDRLAFPYPLAISRSSHAATSLTDENCIVVAGGWERAFGGGWTTDLVEAFCQQQLINGTVTATYRAGRMMGGPRANLAAPYWDFMSLAVFAGGVTSGDRVNKSASVDMLSADLTTIKRQWNMSEARSHLAAVSFLVVRAQPSLLILAGGQTNPSQPSATVDILEQYPFSPAQFSTARLSQARWSLAGVAFGDLALFAGGFIASGVPSDRVDIVNRDHVWSQASLSAARGLLAASSTSTVAVFVGGGVMESGSPVPSDIIDLFDGTSWYTARLHTARYGLAAVPLAMNGRQYVLVGGGGYFDRSVPNVDRIGLELLDPIDVIQQNRICQSSSSLRSASIVNVVCIVCMVIGLVVLLGLVVTVFYLRRIAKSFQSPMQVPLLDT
jgi:hypothetical protein